MSGQRHGEFKTTFKPGRRHKFRLNWLPMTYQQSGVLPREVVFQGIRYDAGPAGELSSSVSWNAWRLGYEFDVVVHVTADILGLILEAKITEVRAELQTSGWNRSSLGHSAPIPAIGAIGRVYVTRFTPVTAEFTAFKMPDESG